MKKLTIDFQNLPP